MISDSVKSTASKVFSGVKTAAKAGGDLLLNELVYEIESRSPGTAKLGRDAKNKINQIKASRKLSAENYKAFVQKDVEGAEEFRSEIQKNDTGLKSQKELDKAALNIIRKIEKSIEKDSEKAKESDLYKKYEKNFEAYSNSLKDQSESIKSEKPTKQQTSEKPNLNNSKELISEILAGMKEELDKDENLSEKEKQEFLTGVETGMKEEIDESLKVQPEKKSDIKILNEIADNTEETVKILKENKDVSKTESPKTIQSAVSTISSNFLSKVFSDKTLEHYSDKLKDSLGIPKESPSGSAQDITSDNNQEKANSSELNELKKINDFLRAERKVNQLNSIVEEEKSSESLNDRIQVNNNSVEPSESIIDKLESKKISSPIPEDAISNEDDDINDTRRGKKRSKRQNKKIQSRSRPSSPIEDKITQAGKDKNYIPKPEAAKKISGGRFIESSKTVGSAARGVSMASAAAGTGALWAGGALLAGAAGYGVGTLLSKGIDSGLSAMTGQETSLGGWIYDKFHDTPELENAPATVKNVAKEPAVLGKPLSPKQIDTMSSSISSGNTYSPEVMKTHEQNKLKAKLAPESTSKVPAIDSAIKKQDVIKTEKEEKSSQPIIINSGDHVTNNSSKSGGSGALVSSPVRNTESTYERTQMNSFWPRAK